jgi:hypothetical protein
MKDVKERVNRIHENLVKMNDPSAHSTEERTEITRHQFVELLTVIDRLITHIEALEAKVFHP